MSISHTRLRLDRSKSRNRVGQGNKGFYLQRRGGSKDRQETEKEYPMAKEQDNKAIVARWFTEFWGKPWNPNIVDELATPDILLQYSLHAPRRGRQDVKAFMTEFRRAFPDLKFWGVAESIKKRRRRSIPMSWRISSIAIRAEAICGLPNKWNSSNTNIS